MQNDGNLVLYDENNKQLLDSKTVNQGDYTILDNDGGIKVFSGVNSSFFFFNGYILSRLFNHF